MNAKVATHNPRTRIYVVAMALALGASAIVVRAVDLEVVNRDFYRGQGEQRFVRERVIPASRGAITDRNGEALAISTPVESLWAVPGQVLEAADRLPELARALAISPDALEDFLDQRRDKEFVYLRRHVAPDQAAAAMALKIPGVNSQREYKRYYPAGPVFAHVLGYTDIDDRGQEGLELSFDEWLSGSPGMKRVIQNLRGEVVENVELVRDSQPGRDLRLSLDRRLQYLAFRELGNAITANRASGGSMVILDVDSGEILAMVNTPSYNPNARNASTIQARRNRAVTDVFEPGSVAKAFTVSAGLESGKFTPETRIDTSPGTFLVGNHIVRDVSNHGVVDLTGLLMHSSNVGATKMSLELTNDHMFDMLHRFGFGQASGSGFPGESAGVLPLAKGWGVVEKATISYGYGFSVTALQLASAYAALGNGGRLRAPTFVAGTRNPDVAVLDPNIARKLVQMLESVVSPGGTGVKAAVPNFRVAGKTGTSHKFVPGGYENRYICVFAGLVPASHPRLAGVVVIDDPKGNVHFGGLVSAPVFGRVMTEALRLLDVAPDNLDARQAVSMPGNEFIPAAGDAAEADAAFAEGAQP